MAETTANEVLSGEGKAEENKTPPENLTTLETPEQETGKPPQEIPAPDIADTSPAPEGEKQSEAKEAEKQPAEQGKTGQEAPADEKLRKEQEALLKSLDSKSEGFNKKNPPPKKKDAQAKPGKSPADKAGKGKADKPASPKQTEKPPKENKKAASVGGGGIGGGGSTPQEKTAAMAKEMIEKHDAPPEPAAPPAPEPPRDANRINETETIVYIAHADLHPFKDHPFKVRDDDAMKTLIESVKERGVDQPAIVRPREGGGYELIAGHRRQAASEMAGIKNVPCVVRNMTDEEAVLAMTESNFNQRSEILASERAQALKMQLDAIKRQGERFKGIASGDVGKRSNEIVADRNKMGAKTVQRYIALNNLTPDLMKLTDDKKIPFMTAFEMSYIKPKNQEYIAMTIEAQGSAPTLAQAQRMRELDSKGILNGDVIDGIMLEEKKEDRKVIISGQELAKYFGPEKSPKEMKDAILKLLDENKAKNPPDLAKPDKKQERDK